jgi:peptidyl-prolyl cis-trans isomerase D
MATLEKIRNKAGLLVIVVGLALFAFIIGDFLNSGSTFFRQSQERIANINGEVVTIHDYQDRVDEMTEVYKMQTNSNNVSEDVMTQIRQSVFDAMVQEIVLGEATSQVGVTVSPEELFDLVQGENVSPLIQQMPMFQNPETQTFDKAALLNFLKAIDDDNIASYPADQQAQLTQAKNFWLFWEKNIKQQALGSKYTTLLSKAISANKIDAQNAFNSTVENSDVAYVIQSYNTIPDSAVVVSDSEIKKLYEQRKQAYKQAEGRVIKYISVDIVPSPDDYAKATAEVESIREELLSSDKIADIVNEVSETPYVDAFVSDASLDAEAKLFVKTSEIGAVSTPSFQNDRHRLMKLVAKTVAPDSVKIAHIMIRKETEAATAALADSLKSVLDKGGNFAELAKEYSLDGTAENGGELGWFTEVAALQGLNEDFKNTVFSTPLNGVAIVKSLYGTHIVKVLDKTANVEKYKLANIEFAVSPSSKTYSNIYNDLNQFISMNNKADKLEDAAKESGYNLVSNVTVTAADQRIGFIQNSRPVVRWAFEHDKGSISEIFECDNKFIVAAVQGKVKEGYRSLNALSASLRGELATQKKGEQIVQTLSSKNLTSLDAYSGVIGSAVDSVKFVNFGTSRIAGIGVEPKLNAYISLAQVNQLSTPIAGDNGVYVFQVYNREKSSAEFDEKATLQGLNASNSYRIGYSVIQELINNADIEDNRIRFY